uniref:Uncharacterized protein n=1 Tax=Parascaris equorum TaxID=6256 RepID=A0A914RR88_PAREQ
MMVTRIPASTNWTPREMLQHEVVQIQAIFSTVTVKESSSITHTQLN